MRGRSGEGRLSEPSPLSYCIGRRILGCHIILWGRCWLVALRLVTESSSVREIILLKPSQGGRRPHHSRQLSVIWSVKPGVATRSNQVKGEAVKKYHVDPGCFSGHTFFSLFGLSKGGSLSLITVGSNDQSRGPVMGKVALGFSLPSRTSEVCGKLFLSVTGHKTGCAVFFPPTHPFFNSPPLS